MIIMISVAIDYFKKRFGENLTCSAYIHINLDAHSCQEIRRFDLTWNVDLFIVTDAIEPVVRGIAAGMVA